AADDVTLVCEVERWQRYVLGEDVLPDIHLGPVREREHAEVLTWRLPAVEQVPQLGALVLRIPLAEAVAVGEKSFLGACLLLIAASAAKGRIDLELTERVEECDGLEAVAAGIGAGFLLRASLIDRVLHIA